jgi:4'-phosphopantetheinyl transferase
MQARLEVRLVDGRTVSDALLAGVAGWLSEAERARYRRFVRRERQRQFLIGRVLARQALGVVLDVAPQQLVIEEVPGLKPRLAGTPFSISHSGPWVACAAGGSGELGLDIERIDPARDIAALALQAFDAERCAWLAARPAATRLRDFYQLWSTQEAAIKLGAPALHTIQLFHPELAIVLCCAQPPAQAPRLLAVNADQLVHQFGRSCG